MYSSRTEGRDSRLTALMSKSQHEQWASDERIDWSLDIVLPRGIRTHIYVDLVSQLYYAEEATLQICSRMIAELPELQAKQYVCMQAADEARHLEIYRNYLQKLGDISPIDPGLKNVFDNALEFNGPAFGLVAALNVVMEHEALNQQKRRIATLPCPLFKQINQAIIRDESRHAAFGVIYLRRISACLQDEDKSIVSDWLRELWLLWLEANRERYTRDGEEELRLDCDELLRRGQHVGNTLWRLGLFEERNALG